MDLNQHSHFIDNTIDLNSLFVLYQQSKKNKSIFNIGKAFDVNNDQEETTADSQASQNERGFDLYTLKQKKLVGLGWVMSQTCSPAPLSCLRCSKRKKADI